MTDDEIEFAGRQQNDLWSREFDLGFVAPGGLSAGEVDEGRRIIHGRDGAYASRERQREAADAAAILERGDRRKVGREWLDDAEHPLDERLTRGVELAFPLGREVGAAV